MHIGLPEKEKGTKFLQCLRKRHFQIGIGAHNALGAQLIEAAGFDFVWASGLEISVAAGVPDASILGMEKFLEAASVINRVTSLPVIADCDTGFGGINNTIYMAEQYVTAGIGGVCIEDKVFPKTNSFVEAHHQLEAVEDFTRKIENIKRIGGGNLAVIARTEAFIAGEGVDVALARANYYAAAGADAILVHSKKSDAIEIREFMNRWVSIPIIVVPTAYATISMSELQEIGVTAAICANQLIRASIKSMEEALTCLKNRKELSAVDHLLAPLSTVLQMGRHGKHWQDV